MKNSNGNFGSFYKSPVVVGCLILATLIVIPLVYSSPYFLRLAVLTFIYCILTVSLSLLLDFTGIVSLGQAAFFGIGAYVTGVLSTQMGLTFWVTLSASAVISAMIAALFGRLTLKTLKGIYFALASWALVEVSVLRLYERRIFRWHQWHQGNPGTLGFWLPSGYRYIFLLFHIDFRCFCPC